MALPRWTTGVKRHPVLRGVDEDAAYGVPETDIARVIGIDLKTPRKHYRDRLDLGATKATVMVAEFHFRKAATEGLQCVTTAIFWMKIRGGWRETPQTHAVAVKPASKMTDEGLLARIRELDVHVRPLIDLKPTDKRDPLSSRAFRLGAPAVTVSGTRVSVGRSSAEVSHETT